MRLQPGIAFQAVVLALATLVPGCSSSQDKAARGSLSVTLAASDDARGTLLAANVTISEMEARKSDGTWVTVDGGLPTGVDLLALARSGDNVALPADFLREGHHNALQVRIARLELTLEDGARVTIPPPRTGWCVRIPVDFGVVTDEKTTVSLIVRLDRSFHRVNGQFEFEPEVEVQGVTRG